MGIKEGDDEKVKDDSEDLSQNRITSLFSEFPRVCVSIIQILGQLLTELERVISPFCHFFQRQEAEFLVSSNYMVLCIQLRIPSDIWEDESLCPECAPSRDAEF